MAALLWMTPCTFIALGQLNYYQQQLQKEEEEAQQQLPTMASGSSYGKGPATEPISHVAPMDRHDSPDPTAVAVSPQHSGAGKSTGHQATDAASPPGAAAAADARPAHLQNLTSDIDDHAGVTPVADNNGRSFKY